MNTETPSITACTYGTTTNGQVVSDGSIGNLSELSYQRLFSQANAGFAQASKQNEQYIQTPATMTKRIVRVYLADTDENVPLEKSLLFTSPEKLTDLNDQELYFEIPIQALLAEHNSYRKTLVDKKATQKIGKEVFLEPVKIRDLKMLVVTIASF